MDSQETQYDRLSAALTDIRRRIPSILAEAHAARARSIELGIQLGQDQPEDRLAATPSAVPE
ncbi:MAG TPA: hypothetical protein VJT84_12755 [Gaiellaceae bacterium]|nr:hypothetical protein [Gaiellaceae bacterium]